MSKNVESSTNRPTDSGFSRRKMIAGTGAVTAAAMLGVRLLPGASAQETQVAATPVPLGSAIPPEITDGANDWPTENKDLTQTRYASGSAIDSTNVASLEVAWTYVFDVTSGYGASTANPIISGDVLYTTDQLSNVYAFNKDTGEQIWRTDYNIPTIGPNGLSIGYGVIAHGLGDSGIAVALDAATGTELWRATLTNNVGEGIDMAPLIYDNTVYISTVPGNSTVFYRGGQKGIFYALDITSGDTIWQWDTTTDNLWGNARVNSGGGLWHPPAVDEEGQLYIAVANPAPWPGNSEFPNGSSRPGENLYSNCIVKLDPATGSVVWYNQVMPHDIFDLDQQLSPVLTKVTIAGAETDIVVASGKHGYVLGIDRQSGITIWRTPIGKHQNDTLTEVPDDVDYIEVYPSSLGGVEVPFAVADGVGFFALMNRAAYYTPTGRPEDVTATPLTEVDGQVVAIDLATGKILWDNTIPTAGFGGATVVNDVVFSGGLDGVFRAYSVTDGSLLWSYQAPAGINATPAIVGDTVYLVAATALLPSVDTESPAPELATSLIALKLPS